MDGQKTFTALCTNNRIHLNKMDIRMLSHESVEIRIVPFKAGTQTRATDRNLATRDAQIQPLTYDKTR